jgi:molybdenum cofactor synthesis domain-containing protein
VRSTDVAEAAPQRPVVLRVIGEVAAGHAPRDAVVPGTAVRILTGARVPEGADAVVPVEDTDAPAGAADLPERVAVHVAASPGRHIRSAGSDLQAGAVLLSRGHRLTPQRVALVAAAGHTVLPVHRRPSVAVLATGDELVAVGEPLGPSAIPDSNSEGLAAQAASCGADVVRLGIAPDDRDAVLGRLLEGIAVADVLVVSGGVSVGAHDVVKEAFERVGRLDLWRVAIQPGKPLAFGRAPRPDRGTCLFFGLPGNPVSSFVTFELFVRPVLRRMLGFADPSGRLLVRATLAEAVTTSQERRAFVRVRLEPPAGPGGLDRAHLAGGQGSYVLSALALAQGLAIVPEGVDQLPEGAEVEVIRLDTEID